MFVDDNEWRRAELERHRQNSARLATAWATFRSTGQGGMEFEDRCDFGLTFIEKPRVAYGSFLDLDALGELIDHEAGETPPMPSVSGFVTDWDVDARGFYVGAWVACAVRFDALDAVDATVMVEVQHDFTFTAVAMKDLPMDESD